MSLYRMSHRFVELLGCLYILFQLPLKQLDWKIQDLQAGPLQTALPPSFFLFKYLLHNFEVCAESSRVNENKKKTQKCKKARCFQTFDRKCMQDIYNTVGHKYYLPKRRLDFFLICFLSLMLCIILPIKLPLFKKSIISASLFHEPDN